MKTVEYGMVRITIERMDEPKDRMIGQLEVPAFLVIGELTGEVEEYFTHAFGGYFTLPIDRKELDAHFRQSAEV